MADEELDELIEVYRAPDALSAQAVVDEILSPNGFHPAVRNRASQALPGLPGAYFIAVPGSEAEAARATLREAELGDGVVSDPMA